MKVREAHLEPYFGFLPISKQPYTMSLVCDFQEITEPTLTTLIDYLQTMNKKDFVLKTESSNRRRKGKREYLRDSETTAFMDGLNGFFETMVELKRLRNGERQTIETLINEAQLFAKFLRGENKNWIPDTQKNKQRLKLIFNVFIGYFIPKFTRITIF